VPVVVSVTGSELGTTPLVTVFVPPLATKVLHAVSSRLCL
jgi:hypothetical protein